MKDYMTIYARVKSIKVTLENIKTGKIKTKESNFPDSLWNTELEIVNPDETQIVKDRMTQHKLSILNDYYKVGNTYDKKWKIVDTNICIDFEERLASERSADWCLSHMSIPQLISMGVSIVKTSSNGW